MHQCVIVSLNRAEYRRYHSISAFDCYYEVNYVISRNLHKHVAKGTKTSGGESDRLISRLIFGRGICLCFLTPNTMGIHGLSKVIGDYAPSAVKENEIKNYFGKHLN